MDSLSRRVRRAAVELGNYLRLGAVADRRGGRGASVPPPPRSSLGLPSFAPTDPSSMPELPEVEYATQRLAAATAGKRLVAVRTLHPAVARGFSPADGARLAGRRVSAVERRGKYQLLHLEGDLVLVAHFRMAGDWVVGTPADPPRFARAVLELGDGTAVFLIDSRAFATLVLRPRGGEGLPTLGVDAADPALDGATLGQALAGRRGPVKPALLNQAVVAGLGNIYAAEALWHARVSPFTPAAALEPGALDRLASGIGLTLGLARADPGRYSRGEGLDRLMVYGRAGEPCVRCTTAIVRVPQAGRSTFYCPVCQADAAEPKYNVGDSAGL